MRPNHGCTVLRALVLAGMLLDLKADDENTSCEVDVKVNRNTVFEAFLGKELRINCTVEFCSNPLPTVSWNKREDNVPINISSTHLKTEWNLLNDSVGVSFLIFQKVGINDSGLYQCTVGESVSHYINVSVHGDGERTNPTSSDNPRPTPSDLWLYAYFAAGIAALVAIVVIVTVTSLRGCKGKSKKEAEVENQYTTFVMSEQPFRDCGPPPPPTGSPSAPPCRRSTRRSTHRKTPPSHPNEQPIPPGGEHVCGTRGKDRERRGVAAEEPGGSIFYATLKLPPPGADAATAGARPWRPRQETSEYAAICVQEPARLTL